MMPRPPSIVVLCEVANRSTTRSASSPAGTCTAVSAGLAVVLGKSERPSASASLEQTRSGAGSRRLRRTLASVVIHGVLLCGLIVMLTPLIWMLSTSLKDPAYVFNLPPQWLPRPVRWSNYAQAFQQAPLLRYFGNTVLITGLDVVGKLASCSLVAFSFSRLRWKGRALVFLVMLSTLMLPPQVTLIPQFVGYRLLGWVNTFLPLVVPPFFGASGFNIFLLRQFFMTLPREMDESAIIDGANHLQIWWRIALPMSLPALGLVAILQFIFSWNDFFGPLIYLSYNNLWTVSLGLYGFIGSYGTTDYTLLMAAALVIALPCIVLFFIAQRYFIQGIVVSGVKG